LNNLQENIIKIFCFIKFEGATLVSIKSKDEMEFVTNNVDAKPLTYQMWIGLAKNNQTGMKIY
jgi:hypothetical protein